MAIGRARSFGGFQDPALARRVERVLEEGERLHWVGRPDPWKRAAAEVLLGFGMFVLFTVAALLVRLDPGGLAQGFDDSVRLLASVPLMVAAFLCLAIPVYRYVSAAATIYAVTDRRAIVLRRFPPPWTQSFRSHDMNCLETTSHGGGAGSVMFRWDRREGRRWTSWRSQRNPRVNLGGGWSIGGDPDDTWSRHEDPDDELGARDRGEIVRQGFFDVEDVAGAEQHLRRIVGDAR
jgi:hypothetical protein